MVAFRSKLVEVIIVGGGTCQGIEWSCHKFRRKFKETSLCRNRENVPKIALNATKLSEIDALDMTEVAKNNRVYRFTALFTVDVILHMRQLWACKTVTFILTL